MKTLKDLTKYDMTYDTWYYKEKDLLVLAQEWIKRHDNIIKGFPKYGDSSSYIAINRFIKYVFNLEDKE